MGAVRRRGACLLFDRPRLERAIGEQWPDEGRYSDKVDYAREGSAEVFRRALNADEILAHEQPTRAVRDHIKANRDAYFFLKSDDFATEHEYRVVLAGGDGDHIFIEYSDSLVGVVLGERFPAWQEPGAIKACSNAGVKKQGSNALGERPPARWSSVARDTRRALPCAIGIAIVLASDAAGLG